MSLSSAAKRLQPPKYCRQREKNRPDRACVCINGKRITLGAYNSPESWNKYRELTGQKELEKPRPASVADATVATVMVRYLQHAKVYYQRADGKPSREYEMIRETLRFVRRNCSALPARDFGPKRLKEIRQAMIDADHSRKYINKNIGRIKRMFRWAVEEELVPSDVHMALTAVRGLKCGRTTARETAPVMPVADSDVDATLEHLPQVVADMVRLQRLTAMRAGELVQMRPCDIDRSGDVWVYRPPTHKTQHQGRSRVVIVGPKSQAILASYLARGDKMHLFRPIDSEAKRRAEVEASRKTPKSCGNSRGTNRVDQPKRKAGDAYTVDSYRRAIARACDRAFPAPDDLPDGDLQAWQSVHRWSPHQLRHSAATEIRKEFGLEGAQIILGHSQADVTQIYAERDLNKGLEIMRQIG